jgi:hypothetical protein
LLAASAGRSSRQQIPCPRQIREGGYCYRHETDIESRFFLLITISLFFPVLLENFAAIANQPAAKGSLLLVQTSVVVKKKGVRRILLGKPGPFTAALALFARNPALPWLQSPLCLGWGFGYNQLL